MASWFPAPNKKPRIAGAASYLPFALISAFGGERVELRREIFGRAIERGELQVVRLRHFDAVALAKLHHNIEKIHAIELELVAKADVGFDVAQILIGRDVRDDIEHHLLAFVFGHSQGRRIRRQTVEQSTWNLSLTCRTNYLGWCPLSQLAEVD